MENELVRFDDTRDGIVAILGCEIDHHTAARLREAIDGRIFLARPKVVTLDFSSVRFMDSSGIALILGRVECAEAVGARVQLTGLSGTLYKLVRLAGLEKIKNLTVTPCG